MWGIYWYLVQAAPNLLATELVVQTVSASVLIPLIAYLSVLSVRSFRYMHRMLKPFYI
jgi:hypothetical protein